MSEKEKKKPVVLCCVIGLAILVVSGIVSWMMSNERKPTLTELPDYTRDSLAEAPEIDIGKIFSAKKILGYELGDGLKAKFSVTFRGQPEWSEQLEIPLLDTTVDFDHPARRALVKTKQREFEDLVNKFSTYKSRIWTIEFLLDDTDGVNESLKRQIDIYMEDLNLKKRLTKGDGINFWTFRLSSTDYLNYERALISSGSGPEAYGRIEKLTEMLVENKPAQKETSLATGLFNALTKNSGEENRVIAIFSDGLENSELGDFYVNPPRVDDDKLIDNLQSKVCCPFLKGTWVYWFGPKTGQNSNQIRKSLDFWKALLEEKGAKVKIEY